MKRADRVPRGAAGFTLIEVLIATVILSFGSVAVVGALGTLSSGSAINRVQSSVASVVRNAAETIKLAAYIPCTNTGGVGSTPAFITSAGPPVVYGYTTQDLAGPVLVPNDPPGNPPQKPTVISVTNQNGQSLNPSNTPNYCGSQDPGLQLVTVQDKSTDGKITATLVVAKSAIDHTPNPAATPTVTGTANAGSPFLIGASATDSVNVVGTGVTPTGNAHFYICGPNSAPTACSIGAANLIDLGTVVLSGAGTATSTPYIPTAVGTWCFLVSYLGDLNYNPNSDATVANQCFSVTAPPTQFPLLVSATSGGNTLVVQGMHGSLSVVGPLMVDSSSVGAVMTGAAGDLTATGLYTAGVPSTTCSGAGCSPLWVQLAPPADPLATLAAPTGLGQGACTVTGAVDNCTAGSYSKDPNPGGPVTTVNFSPGVYLFNAGLTLNGPNMTVNGAGVFFYIAQGKATLTPANWNVSAPTSGAYQGILLFEARNDMQPVVIGNNTTAATLPGMIYAPDAPVQFMGNPMTKTLTVGSVSAQTVTVQDNTTVVIG